MGHAIDEFLQNYEWEDLLRVTTRGGVFRNSEGVSANRIHRQPSNHAPFRAGQK
jgi:hypothetical protein